jgi:hypothetical protein
MNNQTKITFTGFTFLTIILILAFSYYGDSVLIALSAMFWLIVAVVVVVVVFGGWYLSEKILAIRNERITNKYKGEVLVINDNNGGIYIRDCNPHASWQALHLMKTPNGEEASPVDIQIWTSINTMRFSNHNTVNLPTSPSILALGDKGDNENSYYDLLTVFTQPLQAYAVIGGQQTGKTFQSQHIASEWLKQGITPILVGPKWDVGEWVNCIRLGGNDGAMDRAIQWVREQAKNRRESGLPHKSHGLMPVFFDDWTHTNEVCQSAKSLILEATTLFASVNIILYFVIHSDTANAWGVGAKGASLKDNFVKLIICPHYDQSGLVDRRKTRAYIRFPDGSEKATLLKSLPIVAVEKEIQNPYDCPIGDINGGDSLSSEEQLVMNLHNDGVSISKIATKVFGNRGGPQNQKVKDIIKKCEVLQ